VAWKETPDETEFLARVGPATLILGRGNSGSGSILYVRILDNTGKIIEEFNDEMLDARPGGEYYKSMLGLYQGIQRKLSGADEYLDEILSNLPDEDSPF